MKAQWLFVVCFLAFLPASECRAAERTTAGSVTLVDPKATKETRALFINLRRQAGNKVLFGHQNSTLYGIGWKGDPERSDVKTACGAFPAVYGWDMNNMGKFKSADGKDLIPVRIREAYERGGVNTISWHMSNPVTGKNFYDTTKAVSAILPDGPRHREYQRKLDQIAEFVGNLRNRNGTLIPIIFRPFHEHTGSWFWWGKGHCAADEYVELWRFTVRYLRDTKGVHNLLYAYSPAKNISGSRDDYFWGYPGDKYVDILGYDHYSHSVVDALPGLRLVVQLAEARNKVPAFTETGIPQGLAQAETNVYYTQSLLAPLKKDKVACRIAYVLVWQNRDKEHFWIPYVGHKSLADFKEFAQDSFMVFGDRIADMYSFPRD